MGSDLGSRFSVCTVEPRGPCRVRAMYILNILISTSLQHEYASSRPPPRSCRSRYSITCETCTPRVTHLRGLFVITSCLLSTSLRGSVESFAYMNFPAIHCIACTQCSGTRNAPCHPSAEVYPGHHTHPIPCARRVHPRPTPPGPPPRATRGPPGSATPHRRPTRTAR